MNKNNRCVTALLAVLFCTATYLSFGQVTWPPLPPMPPGYWESLSNTVGNGESFGETTNSEGPEAPPLEGGGGGGGGDTNSYPPAFNYTNGLWIGIYSHDSNWMTLTLNGTIEDQYYEMLTKTNLSETAWKFELGLIGVSNITLVNPIPYLDRTNLFFWARHGNLDTDGDGLPDWYELQIGTDPDLADTGDTGTSDGYLDSDADGWTNIEEFQNGTNPSLFTSPPKGVADLRVTQSETNTNHFVLTWEAPSSSVSNYTVLRTVNGTNTTFTIAGDLTTWTDTTAPQGSVPSYQITANYAAGSSMSSPTADSETDTSLVIIATVVRGPKEPTDDANGISPLRILLGGSVSSEIAAIRVFKTIAPMQYRAWNGSSWQFYYFIAPTNWTWTQPTTFYDGGYFDVPLSQFTNGVYRVPYSQATAYGSYYFQFQPIGTNAAFGLPTDYHFVRNVPFTDGSAILRDNLSFILQATRSAHPSTNGTFRFGANNSYAHVNATRRTLGISGIGFDELTPFYDNHYLRNWAYDVDLFWDYTQNGNNYSSFYAWTGISPDGSESVNTSYIFDNFYSYYYVTTGNTQWLNANISSTNHIFVSAAIPVSVGSSLNNASISWNDPNTSIASSFTNAYGLSYTGIRMVEDRIPSGSTEPITWDIAPGGSVQNVYPLDPTEYFQQVASPSLSTVEYYFASTNSSVPGDASFAVTNTSPLIFAPVGRATRIYGWAKQEILNGAPNKFGYLGQYFDKGYTTTNGVATSTETGILSEYGEFFPTEPGRMILKTKPDTAQTNLQGQCTVYAISLNVDANHDGEMNRTFGGPDNTSADQPFRFWINNDFDLNDKDIETTPPNGLTDLSSENIQCARGLEDLARLWISGMPTLDSSYEVKLSMTPSLGSPAIRLYEYTAESNGGTGYLTDTNVANSIVNGSSKYTIAHISPTTSYTLPVGYFSDGVTRHFLFEGAATGRGELVLSIRKGGQTIAETSVFLELLDVKSMFERVVVDNVTASLPPSELISRHKVMKSPVNPQEAKQLIVFVHGINNTDFDYRSTSETMFKRLYWSGYQGRFASVRWQCAYLPPNAFNPYYFNRGEFYAWKSANGFASYLSRFRERYPAYQINVYAHSQGNAVVSEALRNGAPFDNYILTQAALPAHCYDVNAPFLQKLLDAEVSPNLTPLQVADGGYHGYFTNLTGNLINFYNTNDFALASGTYLGLQTNWEENHRSEKPEAFLDAQVYQFDGTNCLAIYSEIQTITVTDPYEKMSMVARSRSRAIGAQPPVGQSVQGVISVTVDLEAQFGFGETRREHSAQFTRSIQTSKLYYDRIVDVIDVP